MSDTRMLDETVDGLRRHDFRDWLSLLITPFVLPIACRWLLAVHQGGAPVAARVNGRRVRLMGAPSKGRNYCRRIGATG